MNPPELRIIMIFICLCSQRRGATLRTVRLLQYFSQWTLSRTQHSGSLERQRLGIISRFIFSLSEFQNQHQWHCSFWLDSLNCKDSRLFLSATWHVGPALQTVQPCVFFFSLLFCASEKWCHSKEGVRSLFNDVTWPLCQDCACRALWTLVQKTCRSRTDGRTD